MRYLPSLAAIAFFSLPVVACGGDDDDGGELASCGIELVSVEDAGDNNFTIRARNNNDVAGQVSFVVIYSEGDIQDDDQGIGVAGSVQPGGTVEIETIGGFAVADFDCARLQVTFISTASGVVCQDQRIGEECYN